MKTTKSTRALRIVASSGRTTSSAPQGRLRLVGGTDYVRPATAPSDASADYARFFGPITGRLADPLLDAAGVRPGTRVLDVASGPGCLAARAARRGATVVGVDIDPNMVELASRRHPQLRFLQADAAALPFEDGSFDAVVGNFLVQHLRSPRQAIAELVRVLAPGGVLALTVWDLPARTRFVGVFLEAIEDGGGDPPGSRAPRPDFFRYSADPALAGLLSGEGLCDVAISATAFEHAVASTEELWNGLLAGTDRTSATRIARQPRDVQRRIRTSFERRANEYWTGERLELPVSAKVACGRRLAA